ncbi:shikimate / quinate 5-dehydrogenase, protein [Paecilomyces variotii No. 5]|uniref:Shikimate / quinate 5-dehydrogenase, protein n=1 Tax=Byssochlamys spectabilis (strain No. 5 / NBRC 109023) TaxID=1356009 RepID=V5FVR9_BYSSN|nr:shikimate / quinate 5-dehydrogenase, protein [Paecilomyces variotii No. 5]
MDNNEEKTLHLVGIGVTHSIAPGMHNYITKSLGLPWTFYATECPSLDDLMLLAEKNTTAGLVVTMPYKTAIIPRLDELDELALAIGACNNVYYKGSNPRRLCGTNTDWIGIKGCLLEKSSKSAAPDSNCGLIIGAGGASRAAVYALTSHLNCATIYVLNRDDQEVETLIQDSKKLPKVPNIIHVKTIEQAQKCTPPHYIVGTVPDMEPMTEAERSVATILRFFLEQQHKGVLLDMCFKPRQTRMLKLADSMGWSCVEGTHVIGYQIEKQYTLWAGDSYGKRLDKEGAWKTLLEAAEKI